LGGIPAPDGSEHEEGGEKNAALGNPDYGRDLQGMQREDDGGQCGHPDGFDKLPHHRKQKHDVENVKPDVHVMKHLWLGPKNLEIQRV
jgi:hypothetical protein